MRARLEPLQCPIIVTSQRALYHLILFMEKCASRLKVRHIGHTISCRYAAGLPRCARRGAGRAQSSKRHKHTSVTTHGVPQHPVGETDSYGTANIEGVRRDL